MSAKADLGDAWSSMTRGVSAQDLMAEAISTIDLAELADRITERCTAIAFAQHANDAEFTTHLHESVLENLLILSGVLKGETKLEDVHVIEPLEFAKVQAQLGIAQTAMQRSYRVSFLTTWQDCTHRLQELAERGDFPRDLVMSAMEEMTGVVFGYQDRVASEVAETYARVDDALSRSLAHIRQRLIREVLQGDEEEELLSPSDVVTIGYDFGLSHLAILFPSMPVGADTQLLVGLRDALKARQTLVYHPNLRSTLMWLGSPGRWTSADVTTAAKLLSDVGVAASLSQPHEGLSGFRRTLEEAREVEEIRLAWAAMHPLKVIQHAQVGLEVLLLRDRAMARRFVNTELGPLAANTNEAQRLRETLEASFTCGSHVATAEKLRLHEHTVRNRLHKAEQLLGSSLQERRTEIQVALRLRELLIRPK